MLLRAWYFDIAVDCHRPLLPFKMRRGSPVVASLLLVRALLLPALLQLGAPAASLDRHPHRHRHFAAGFSVASYLPEWRYEGANWDEIARHSTHVILFSLEPARDGGLLALDRLPRAELMADARAAAAIHGAELLLCFGGNGRSDGFSAMVRSDAARGQFVASAVALVEKYGLNGIDYNWEYPGCAPSRLWSFMPGWGGASCRLATALFDFMVRSQLCIPTDR